MSRANNKRQGDSQAFTPTKNGVPEEQASKKLKSPVSAIKNGMEGTLKTDNANKLFIQGSKGGVVTVFVQKPNAVEEAYLAYDYSVIKENDEIAKELQVNEVLFRRSPDGEELMQKKGSQHAWRQFLMIVGEDKNNTENRKKIADKIVAFLNKNAVVENYRWPKQTKFAGDLTASPMGAMDTLLLDKDVFKVMNIAYPDYSVAELAGFPDICGNFFTTVNIEHLTNLQFSAESNSE